MDEIGILVGIHATRTIVVNVPRVTVPSVPPLPAPPTTLAPPTTTPTGPLVTIPGLNLPVGGGGGVDAHPVRDALGR